MDKKILIIGGDSRQKYMSDFFKSRGYSVTLYGLLETGNKNVSDIKQAIKNASIIILPLPLTKNGKHLFSVVPVKETIDEIIAQLNENHIVFAGMINKNIEKKFLSKNVKIVDYFMLEEVTVKNTVPTAQGIIKTIIDSIDYTVNSSKCAIFGYGRVAKTTARTLSALGADVTICARKKDDIATAEINGLKSCLISDFYKISRNFDYIINTVPSLVISREILVELNEDCFIIDVASAPYGTDFAAAFELGIKAVQCPSLPGKVAPKTAGRIIAEAIIDILEEENHE